MERSADGRKANSRIGPLYWASMGSGLSSWYWGEIHHTSRRHRLYLIVSTASSCVFVYVVEMLP